MATFGAYTLPPVQGWTRVKPRMFVETPLPSKGLADRQSLGGLGLIIEVRGVVGGTSKSDLGTKIEEFESLSDGTTRKFNLGLGTSFDALMLEPEFEKSSPLVAHYRVRFVQAEEIPPPPVPFAKPQIVVELSEDVEINIVGGSWVEVNGEEGHFSSPHIGEDVEVEIT